MAKDGKNLDRKNWVPALGWHIHHDIVIEPFRFPVLPMKKGGGYSISSTVEDALNRRQNAIKFWKPPSEQALRLRLLKPVIGKLPRGIYTEWGRGVLAYSKGKISYPELGSIWYGIVQKYLPQIMKLHQKECPDCPWDGISIFPAKDDG